jgi:hypothetical protein
MNDLKVNFNDVTINETDGILEKVKVLMDPDGDLEIWLLKSNFGIIGSGADCFGEIEFWQNGEAVLMSYVTNYDSEMMPTDLLYLNMWVKERGWDLLIDYDLRQWNFDFWARFDGMVEDDEDMNFEYPEDEDDMDFLEYQESLQKAKVPRMRTMGITDYEEFKDHKRDHDKRSENEKRKF